MKTNNHIPKLIREFFTVAICLLAIGTVKAQLNPLGAAYYENQYLSNPAFAGIAQETKISMHYRNQWSAIVGAPVNYAFTGDMGMPDEKSGFGINLNVEKAGLLNRTRIVGTYAYHLQLNEGNSKLNFGVSLGYLSEKLNQDGLNGDINDPSIGSFNNKPGEIDGDLGIAYTSDQLNFQVAVPNLNSFLKRSNRNGVDKGLFYAAVGYKVFKNADVDGYNLEPKIAFRAIKGYSSIIDLGAELVLDRGENSLNGLLVYHSSKSLTGGIGMVFKSKYQLQALYNTQTAELNSYTNGTFELALGVKF